MDLFVRDKINQIELCLKEIKAYCDGKDKVLHTPFLYKDNTKSAKKEKTII